MKQTKISQVASAREEYSPPYTPGTVIIAVCSLELPGVPIFPPSSPKIILLNAERQKEGFWTFSQNKRAQRGTLIKKQLQVESSFFFFFFFSSWPLLYVCIRSSSTLSPPKLLWKRYHLQWKANVLQCCGHESILSVRKILSGEGIISIVLFSLLTLCKYEIRDCWSRATRAYHFPKRAIKPTFINFIICLLETGWKG